jgi:DNA-binding GntR family transcriptional regulator
MSEDATTALAAIAQRRSQSLTAIVQKEIERMILTGALKAGERLNEQALATRLGVSRGPIREATRGLERAGLLTAIVNQGVFVRQISAEEASEIYDVRAVVFGFACERLAGRVTDAQAAALRGFVAEMDRAIERGDSAGYYALNLRFHDAIMDFAAHGRAKQTYQSLIKETHLLRQRALDSAERMRESNGEHAVIVEAMATGDAATARRLAEAHAHGGKRRWLSATRSAAGGSGTAAEERDAQPSA